MRKIIILTIILTLLFTFSITAEEKTGLIRGTITSNNKVLKNVKVEIPELNIEKIIKDGEFELKDLRHTYDRKPYTLVFKKDGFLEEKVKRNVGISRLTLVNVELEKIDNQVTGKTLENTEVKLNDRKIKTEDGNYSFFDIKPDDYIIQYNRIGYDPVTKKIRVNNNEEKDLSFQNMIMKEVSFNDFEENTLIGNYFFNKNFNIKDMFYPVYYLRKDNLENEDQISNLKLVMSSFILAQDFKIVDFVNQNGFNEQELKAEIDKLYKENPKVIKKELKLLNKFREDINRVYSIEEPFNYSVYHINIRDIENKENKPPELKKMNIFRKKYLNREETNLTFLNNEVEESRIITESMRNITELQAEELIKYDNTYLITAESQSEDITFKINRQNINQNQIESVYNFFNIFDNDFIRNFINPYILSAHFKIEDRWKVIIDEK